MVPQRNLQEAIEERLASMSVQDETVIEKTVVVKEILPSGQPFYPPPTPTPAFNPGPLPPLPPGPNHNHNHFNNNNQMMLSPVPTPAPVPGLIPYLVETIMEQTLERIKWDERHNDPKAGVVLKSRDGVHFRVHSWYLRRKSQFVNNLLTLTPEKNLADDFIDLDVSSAAVEHFVDLCYIAGEYPLDIDVPRLRELLAICQKLECFALRESLLRAFRSCALKNPWETFLLAAQYRNKSLAGFAITAFPEIADKPFEPFTSAGAAIDPVPVRWLIEIMRLRYQKEFVGRQARLWTWAEVGKAFDPL